LKVLKEDNVIIGVDLNFAMHRSKVWGSIARVDSLADFFSSKIEHVGFIDIKPISLNPT
jgi:hypothetical protein